MGLKLCWRRFLLDRSGAPAVEFALIAPVLLALIAGAADIAHIAFQRSDMAGAIRSGNQYFMAGGTHLNRHGPSSRRHGARGPRRRSCA